MIGENSIFNEFQQLDYNISKAGANTSKIKNGLVNWFLFIIGKGTMKINKYGKLLTSPSQSHQLHPDADR